MFHDLVVRCRSVRTFDESRPVTEDEVRALIDTSRLCASAANLQPLKYRIVTGDECASVQKLTKWAGALPDLKLPPEGKMPTAFVLICHDTAISKITDCASMDVGIAAQTLVLAAAEVGIGSCMIASFDRTIADVLGIPEALTPRLLIALGRPAEKEVLCAPKNGSVKYFRDDVGLHFVPKRPLDEILV